MNDDYLDTLRKINNEIVEKQKRENFKKYLKDNLLAIIDLILSSIAIIVSIIALFH